MLICSSHNLYIGWKVHKLCIAGNKQTVHKKKTMEPKGEKDERNIDVDDDC